MKTIRWMKIAMMFVAGVLAFTACHDDDDKFTVPQNVREAFSQQYAGATRVEWDWERNGYVVAEFWLDNKKHEAWYTRDGQWLMTEIDCGENLSILPQEVLDAFYASAYSAWTVDDIDMIQRSGYADVYRIEVEQQGQRDVDLYFDLSGTLLHEVTGDLSALQVLF